MVKIGECPLLLLLFFLVVVALQRNVAKQIRNRFPVVSSANGLRKDHGDVYNLEKGETTKSCETINDSSVFLNTNYCSSEQSVGTDLYFGTMLHLLLLRDRVGDHHGFEAGVVDA